MELYIQIAWIALGILLAGLGGEAFFKGVVSLSRWARIPSSLIGLTVAAFATSAPELSIAITSAISDTPELSMGDALGSNIVNVSLVLGLTCILSPITVGAKGITRDLPVAIFQPLLIGILAADGEISRKDAGLLLCVFFIWLLLIFKEASDYRKESEQAHVQVNLIQSVFLIGLGVLLLFFAGESIVKGAEALGVYFGINPFIIGATIVAVGTSVPELATTFISSLRGNSDIGLGTVLGSNIFNGLFIISIAALINPISVQFHVVRTSLIFGLLGILLVMPSGSRRLGRGRGAILLLAYCSYVALIIAPYL